MPSKKKVHMEGNLPYRGGGGSTKSLVKFKKKVGNYYQGRGGPKQYFLLPFPKKTMGNILMSCRIIDIVSIILMKIWLQMHQMLSY